MHQSYNPKVSTFTKQLNSSKLRKHYRNTSKSFSNSFWSNPGLNRSMNQKDSVLEHSYSKIKKQKKSFFEKRSSSVPKTRPNMGNSYSLNSNSMLSGAGEEGYKSSSIYHKGLVLSFKDIQAHDLMLKQEKVEDSSKAIDKWFYIKQQCTHFSIF